MGSDIATQLAQRLLDSGTNVIGTYRTWNDQLKGLQERGAELYEVDLLDMNSLTAFVQRLRDSHTAWDAMIIAAGSLEPIGPFMSQEFEAWVDNLALNGISPLRALHALYPLKRENETGKVILFAGGGTNSPFDNYSAYCLSKIMLIKMAELVHSECDDLDVIVVGTGWVRTKIHQQTLRAAESAGDNLARTNAFLAGIETNEMPIERVVEGIIWCMEAPRDAVGGRNVALSHDPWQSNPETLLHALQADRDLFRLRRNEGNFTRGST